MKKKHGVQVPRAVQVIAQNAQAKHMWEAIVKPSGKGCDRYRIRRNVERINAGKRAPQKRIDTARVNDRKRISDPGDNSVDVNLELRRRTYIEANSESPPPRKIRIIIYIIIIIIINSGRKFRERTKQKFGKSRRNQKRKEKERRLGWKLEYGMKRSKKKKKKIRLK